MNPFPIIFHWQIVCISFLEYHQKYILLAFNTKVLSLGINSKKKNIPVAAAF